jgi:hypothetical protein
VITNGFHLEQKKSPRSIHTERDHFSSNILIVTFIFNHSARTQETARINLPINHTQASSCTLAALGRCGIRDYQFRRICARQPSSHDTKPRHEF